MTNFKKRLILTIFSIPFFLFIVFWPQDTHIILIVLFGILGPFLGSYEFGSLIYKKGINVRKYFLPSVNCLIYIFAYFYANNILNINNFKFSWLLFFIFLASVFSFIYARDVFKKDLTRSLEKVAYTILGIFYIGIPSFFIPLLVNISDNPVNPVPFFLNIESKGTLTGSLLGLLLIIQVFSSDIFSYVFGMAFGRNNTINLEASPKKSWAGYIGGYISSFFWVLLFYIICNKIYHFLNIPLWFYFLITAISGILVPIGDLVESVFKRSAQVKDSGTLILGRGGVLDSIDTMLYYTPVYFLLIQLYFMFVSL